MDYPRCYYGLSWDGDRFKFENMGIIENWRHYLVSEEKKVKWKLALETMAHEFTTMEFRSYVECVMKLSKRTADNWLAEMKRCKAIVFVKQGTWEKNLQIFESDVE